MIYFSIDIETDGLCAGLNNMLSLGCAAIDMENGEIAGVFKRNILPLPNLVSDPSTIAWWSGFPDAYKRATDDAKSAVVVIPHFKLWVESFAHERPVAAAWKPGFDLAFLRYYLFRFCGGDIFGRAGSGLDIKTATAICLNQRFSETSIGTVPKFLKNGYEAHTHDALEDAIEQAYVLYNVRKHLGVRL